MNINEIDSISAFETLSIQRDSFLIDVRSSFEWEQSGVPDLFQIGKKTFFIEWPTLVNEDFIKKFNLILSENFKHSDHIFFICRSGVRSRHAANLSSHIGYSNVFNIIDGFEGNKFNYFGWKGNSLPWCKTG